MKNSFKDKFAVLIFFLTLFTGCFTCATRKRDGCNCRDGTVSSATGSGACSWHGGVSSWTHEYWWEW